MHPIVLAHGYFGFGSNEFIDYFRGIVPYLRGRGHEVHAFAVPPAGTLEERASILYSHIQKKIGERKVDLVCHSMGGLDARYLVSPNGLNKGSHVRSITTIGTPHKGTILADIALEILPHKHLEMLLGEDRLRRLEKEHRRLLNALFRMSHTISSVELPYLENVFGLSAQGLTDLTQDTHQNHFGNPQSPRFLADDTQVSYFCYAGYSPLLRISKPLLIFPELLLGAFDGRNDGLVSVDSQQHGQLCKVIPANHMDQIGYTLNFDHRRLYATIAKNLRGPL